MSLKQWGRKLMLGVALVGATGEAARAEPPKRPSATERVQKDADQAFTELEAVKKERRKQPTEADVWRYHEQALKQLLDALQPAPAKHEAARKKLESTLAKVMADPGLDGTPKQKLEALRYFTEQLLEKLRAVDSKGPKVEIRATLRNCSPIDYLKGQSWEGVKTPPGEDPGLWRTMIENDIRGMYVKGKALEELDAKSVEAQALSRQLQTEKRDFEKQFGPILGPMPGLK